MILKNKKFLGIIAFTAITAAASWGYQQNQNDIVLSDLTQANIDALATPEGEGGNYAWSKLIDCPGIGTGDYRVCESNGPGNSCSNPGGKTCDCGRNC